MKRLKRLFATFIFILAIVNVAYSQQYNSGNIANLNHQLRQMFTGIAPANPQRAFLYDMAVHFVDSVYLDYDCTQNITLNDWYYLYEEMWHCAYDTTWFTRPDSIASKSLQVPDYIVPIAVLNIDYNKIKEAALDTNLYFSFDTINNILSDLPNQPNSPYEVNKIFTASALKSSFSFLNPTFRITPDFIFHDSFNPINYNTQNHQFWVNFDDGNGFILFDPSVTTDYVIHYASSGTKTIIVKTTFENKQEYLSSSTFTIQSNAKIMVEPTTQLNELEGLTVGVYESCAKTSLDKKAVIYLEGFDPFGIRSIQTIYTDMIQTSEIAQLKNFGYDFYIVKWNFASDKIEKNAKYLEQFIDWLNCSGLYKNQQFVIIGESMGGLIARYALAEMENFGFQATCSASKDLNHNTRLLMTFDTPNEGANIPLAYQYLFDDKINPLPVPTVLMSQLFGKYNQLLQSPSSREMLIYHINNNSGTSGCDNLRFQFLENLSNVGSIPKRCKNVAYSNGSLLGIQQFKDYGSMISRSPSDYFADYHSLMKMRIFNNIVDFIETDLIMKSNPNGSDLVYFRNKVLYNYVIRLKRKKPRIRLVLNNTITSTHSKDAINTQALCTASGGKYYLFSVASLATDVDFLKSFFKFDINTSQATNGDYSALLSVGFKKFGFTTTSILHSDALSFGFIPNHSGLGMPFSSGTVPLNNNYFTENINTKLKRTYFDAIVGIPDKFNMQHLNENNGKVTPCSTCASSNPKVKTSTINHEIGDEVLYLTHGQLMFPSEYDAEQYVNVNEYNPEFQYPNSSFSSYVPGSYCKEPTYNILPTGNALFKYNTSFHINNNVPLSGSYQTQAQSAKICCVDYSTQRRAPKKNEDTTNIIINSYFKLYPNPATNHVWLNFKFDENLPIEIAVYNTVGELVSTTKSQFKDSSLESWYNFDLTKQNIKSGIYMIVVNNVQQTFKQKLIVN